MEVNKTMTWKKDYLIKRQTIMIEKVATRRNNSRLLMTMMMMREKMVVIVRRKQRVEIRICGCLIYSSKAALLFGIIVYAL